MVRRLNHTRLRGVSHSKKIFSEFSGKRGNSSEDPRICGSRRQAQCDSGTDEGGDCEYRDSQQNRADRAEAAGDQEEIAFNQPGGGTVFHVS